MNFEQLIIKNRSCRRFDQNRAVGLQTLRYLVDIARRTPSGANRQPLKYILVADAPRCARLFPHLHWAAALKDWAGPAQGERPTAYIIVLADKTVAPNPGCDHGIACQSMMLAAVERGFGGCMVGSIERDAIRADFKVPDKFDILLVVALGVPAEKCVLEEVKPGGSTAYYRDAQGVHHVPKRRLDEIIVDL
jgi:nitroreductase